MKKKFNVWEWKNNKWSYLATATADNEMDAVMMIECRYGKCTYKAYPHIDNEVI